VRNGRLLAVWAIVEGGNPFIYSTVACVVCGDGPTAMCCWRYLEIPPGDPRRYCLRHVCYRHAREPDEGLAVCLEHNPLLTAAARAEF
jgi:hypothetical protein